MYEMFSQFFGADLFDDPCISLSHLPIIPTPVSVYSLDQYVLSLEEGQSCFNGNEI
jgi:hypothetical protein